MVYLSRTVKFPFPIYGTYLHSPNGIAAYLDRKTPVHLCFLCTRSTAWKPCRVQRRSLALYHQYEAVVTHHDCFSMFIQSCPHPPRLACERLWKVAIAKRPWPLGYYELPSIPFTGSYHVLCAEAVKRIASICEIRQLENLPMEMVERIRSHSLGTPLFWRAVTALTVASSLSNLPVIDEQRVGLNKVSRWERGGTIQILGPNSRPSDVLRITFGVDGVRRIERLPQWPTCEKQQQTNERFIWILFEVGSPGIRDRTAYCQYGLLRFCFDNPSSGRAPRHDVLPTIWDTPNLPTWKKLSTIATNSIFRLEESLKASWRDT